MSRLGASRHHSLLGARPPAQVFAKSGYALRTVADIQADLAARGPVSVAFTVYQVRRCMVASASDDGPSRSPPSSTCAIMGWCNC